VLEFLPRGSALVPFLVSVFVDFFSSPPLRKRGPLPNLSGRDCAKCSPCLVFLYLSALVGVSAQPGAVCGSFPPGLRFCGPMLPLSLFRNVPCFGLTKALSFSPSLPSGLERHDVPLLRSLARPLRFLFLVLRRRFFKIAYISYVDNSPLLEREVIFFTISPPFSPSCRIVSESYRGRDPSSCPFTSVLLYSSPVGG